MNISKGRIVNSKFTGILKSERKSGSTVPGFAVGGEREKKVLFNLCTCMYGHLAGYKKKRNIMDLFDELMGKTIPLTAFYDKK
jgi:hypothetical protein